MLLIDRFRAAGFVLGVDVDLHRQVALGQRVGGADGFVRAAW